MNSPLTPAFVFEPNDPGTSPGFVLVLQLSGRLALPKQLQSQTLDLLTGGRAAGCLAVLLVGLDDPPSGEQARQMRALGHRWKVAVEAVGSTADARRFGSWLLGQFYQLFHDCCAEVTSAPLELACLRQMSLDAVDEARACRCRGMAVQTSSRR